MRNRTPHSSHRWYDELQSENTQALLDRLEAEMSKEVLEDTELIDAIARILDERVPAPELEETPEESLQAFRARYAPILDADFKEEKKVRPLGRRVARCAMAACLCMAMFLAVAQACGVDLIGHFLEWGEETFILHGQGGGRMVLDSTPEGEYASTQEAADACGITEPVVVKWIPKNFEIESVRVKRLTFTDDITTYYAADGDKKIVQKIFFYHGEGGNDTTGEHSDPAAEQYVVDDITFLLSSNKGQSRANWVVGNCTCSIVGDITEDEIIRIVDSIFTEER